MDCSYTHLWNQFIKRDRDETRKEILRKIEKKKNNNTCTILCHIKECISMDNLREILKETK